MKRLLVISFFLVFVNSESLIGQINLNFSGGMNYSNCRIENIPTILNKSRIGYFFGLAPGYQISEKVQFLIDFQYSQKGFKSEIPFYLEAKEFRYSYMDIIPEIEYNVLKYLTLGVGVNYGIKLSEEAKTENEDWLSTNKFKLIQSNDFGLTGKLKFSYNNIFTFIRYNMGLKNIVEGSFTDERGNEVDAGQFNRNLQVGMGYSFNVK